MAELGGDGYRGVMSSWDELAAVEEELRRREQAAVAADLAPEELRALAAERDKLAAERDALADADDESARTRDRRGLRRDVEGSRRDRAAREYAQDRDRAAVDRFLAGTDRDFAAGDRTDSGDDRLRAAEARHRAADDRQRAADDRDAAAVQASAAVEEAAGLREALTSRLVIGQAEGLLMARYHLDEDAAFALLVKLSQQTHLKLRVVAERVVDDHASTTGQREQGPGNRSASPAPGHEE